MTQSLTARYEAISVGAKSFLEQGLIGGTVASISAIHLTQ